MTPNILSVVQTGIAISAVIVAFFAYLDNRNRERIKYTLSIFEKFDTEISPLADLIMHETGIEQARLSNNIQLNEVIYPLKELITNLREITNESLILAKEQADFVKKIPRNTLLLDCEKNIEIKSRLSLIKEKIENLPKVPERSNEFKSLSRNVRNVCNFFSEVKALYDRKIIDRDLYMDNFSLITLQCYLPIVDVIQSWTEIGQYDATSFRLLALYSQWHYRNSPGPKDEYCLNALF
jgi:hypothetical protein